MKIVCAACHIGQARALQAVVATFIATGHDVRVILDADHPANQLYFGSTLSFPGCDVFVMNQTNLEQTIVPAVSWADKVLVTLSPTPEIRTSERELAAAALLEDENQLFGYAEVPCGHMAPSWRNRLHYFRQLFVAQKTDDLASAGNIVEVGVDIPFFNPIRALSTKERLGLCVNDPFIWYYGGPYAIAGCMLGAVVREVATFREQVPVLSALSIVFSRHGRDKSDAAATSAYRRAVQVAMRLNVPLIENSADHLRQDTTIMQRADIVPYSLILEACSASGIVVTGHGTDGMVNAPRLDIPSILLVGSMLNPHIKNEKGCEVLPLPPGCPVQITDHCDLEKHLLQLLSFRNQYIGLCRQSYPRQLKSPATMIVESMTA